jgi:hypothetical protein
MRNHRQHWLREVDRNLRSPVLQGDPELMLRCLAAKAAIEEEVNEDYSRPTWEKIQELAKGLNEPIDTRLRVSPYGLSNAVHFRVTDQTVVAESEGSHQTIAQAQRVGVPAVVEGKLSKPGELDYYSFQAQAGEELRFDVAKGEEPSQPEVGETFGLRLAL